MTIAGLKLFCAILMKADVAKLTLNLIITIDSKILALAPFL